MATEAKETSLKLWVDRKSKKVIYAEAKKDFVDLLFGILQLPIGSIMTLLAENDLKLKMAGSLGRVLQSVSDMETSHFHSSQLKDILVKAKVFSPPAQKDCSPPLLLQEFVSCDSTRPTPTPTPTGCCNNSGRRTQACWFCCHVCAEAAPARTPIKVEGFIKADNCPYMVMDNLEVRPLSTDSVIALLKKFNTKNPDERTIKVDRKKVLELVKASMESGTVLTDVFLSSK